MNNAIALASKGWITGEPVVYLKAYVAGESTFGDSDLHVEWARVRVTPHLVTQLRRLASLAEKEALSEVRISGGPDLWGPDDDEGYAFANERLVVYSHIGFAFHGDARHTDHWVETAALKINDFLAAVALGQRVFGDIEIDEDELAENADPCPVEQPTQTAPDLPSARLPAAADVARRTIETGGASYGIELRDAADTVEYQCGECDWSGHRDDLSALTDPLERVQPGELMMAGCCPECGAGISIADEHVPYYTLAISDQIMAQRQSGHAFKLASVLQALLARGGTHDDCSFVIAPTVEEALTEEDGITEISAANHALHAYRTLGRH